MKIIIYTICFLSMSSVFAQISTKIKAHYKFEENLEDASGNNFHGSILFNADYSDGYVNGKALLVQDNAQNGVSIPYQILNGAKDFTITSYVKLNGFNSNNNLLTAANTGQSNEFIIGYNDKNDGYKDGWHIILNNVTYQISPELTLSDKKWHHVVVSRENTTLKLFVDGIKVGNDLTVSDKVLNVSEKGLIVGQDQDCVGGCFQSNQNWDGEIDELTFYEIGLNDKQVNSLYNKIIAHYKFDENLNDDSGNDYHGTILFNTTYEKGVNNQALLVQDNSQNGVSIPYQVLDGAQDFTITSHVRLNGFNSNNNLLTAANTGQANEFIIGYNDKNDNYKDGWHVLLNNVTYQISPELTLSDKKWHHIALLRDKTIIKLFVDGNQVGNDLTVSDKVLTVSEKGLIIGQDQDCVGGCFQSNQNWDGNIDDLCFFRKVLTEDEIKKMSNNVITSTIVVHNENSESIIYPNPASYFLTINTKTKTAIIFSSFGETVKKQNLDVSKTIDVSGLNSGIYYISLYDNNDNLVETQRISIIK